MKRTLKRLFTLLICVCMIGSFMPAFVAMAEEENKNGALNVTMSIRERNGVAVEDYFFRRGIAIEKGLLYSTDGICIKENGTIIPSTAEISEKYDDGSIRWLLVSALVDLKPGEYKKLIVTNGQYVGSTTTYIHQDDRVYVDSEKIDMVLGAAGIESLKYNGTEQLNGTPINMYVTIGGVTHYLAVSKIKVLKHNKLYSKFRLEGSFTNEVSGVLEITLPEKGSRIQIDHRFTVAVQFPNVVTFSSIGLTIGGNYSDANVGTIINSDALNVGNMQLSSLENHRFADVANSDEKTGFIIEENAVSFAPIVNGKDYAFADGMSKTAHLYIGFITSAEDYATTLALPPNVAVDAEQYVKAGGLMFNAKTNPWLEKAINAFVYIYQHPKPRLSMGNIGISVDTKLEHVGSNWGDSPGELEYSLGLAWIYSGNEEIYRQLYDMAETRCDVAIYRGIQTSGHGAMRTSFPSTGSSGSGSYSTTSHGYYGDTGGLYMAAVVTGEEYFADNFLLATDIILSSMYDIPALGTNTVQNITFGSAVGRGDFQESRGLIRPRTMYLAAQYFQDHRYKIAMQDILEWAKKTQRSDGSFSQAVYNNGMVLHQKNGTEVQPPVKDYVALYGFRGISQILDWEENELALDLTLSFADYLCSQGENYGSLFLMPNGNTEVYAYNEDGTRGSSPRDNLLAIDVLCTAYEHSGNERYLKWILKFMENFMATEIDGMGAHAITIKGWNGQGNGVGNDLWRCHTIFRCMDSITEILEKNKEKIEAMGYDDLLVIFSDGAKTGKDPDYVNQEYPYVTCNVYENASEKSLFVSNNTINLENPNDTWERDVEITFNENKLWQGTENAIKDVYSVTLKKYMENMDYFTAMQRPIYVDEFEGNASVTIDEYSEDRLSLAFNGDFETSIRIEDGKFQIKDGIGYSISVNKKDGNVKLTVQRGGIVLPQNGAITCKFNSNGRLIDYVGSETLKKTGLSEYQSNEHLSGKTLRRVIKETFGQDISLSNNPTWGEFARELIGVLGAIESPVFETVGLETLYEGRENTEISDEEAVKAAAEALKVEYVGDALASDVFLTPKSLHNTTVTWSSEREDILTNEGKIDRNNIDCESIKLTATVTKGEASYKKVIEIPLAELVPRTIVSGQKFLGKNGGPLKRQTGEFEITFDVTPKLDKIDAIVILASSDSPPKELGGTAYMVRFNKNGFVDSMDVDWYYSENVLEYHAGTTYHCRMVVNLDNETCDVFVAPDGEAEVQIADDYKPRSTAPKLDNIDYIWAWNAEDDQYLLENISLISFETSKEAEIGIYDRTGKYFGPYDLRKDYVLPDMTSNGKFLNWVVVDSNVKKHGQYVTMHLGKENIKSEKLTVIEILKQVRLLDKNISAESYVTPESLKNLLIATRK